MITIYYKKTRGLYPTFYPSANTFPADSLSYYTEAFNDNGYGVLRDFKSNPKVTEVLNGDYYLEFEYAKDGWLSEYLIEERIIKAPNNGKNQLFRIYFIDKSLNNIKVLAKHIVFDLNDNLFLDVYPQEKTAEEALEWILARSQYKNTFTVWSDILTPNTARYVRKKMIDIFFKETNSIINTWGGEFEFDNFDIKLHTQRGSDNGLQIRYGKNLTGLNVKLDMSTVATRIVPVGTNGLLLPEEYIDSGLIHYYHAPLIKAVDFNIGVTETITEEQAYTLLRDEVQKLFDSGIDLPSIEVKVDFIELSKVVEYASYSDLETVALGDTVKVYVEQLNIDIETRITKITYDCLKERIIKMELEG